LPRGRVCCGRALLQVAALRRKRYIGTVRSQHGQSRGWKKSRPPPYIPRTGPLTIRVPASRGDRSAEDRCACWALGERRGPIARHGALYGARLGRLGCFFCRLESDWTRAYRDHGFGRPWSILTKLARVISFRIGLATGDFAHARRVGGDQAGRLKSTRSVSKFRGVEDGLASIATTWGLKEIARPIPTYVILQCGRGAAGINGECGGNEARTGSRDVRRYEAPTGRPVHVIRGRG